MGNNEVKIPLFKAGDVSGIVYAFFGNIGNFILVAATLMSFGWPKELVFGKVIPGICVGLIFQGFYYAWMAYRLGKKEGRSDVTALPSGLSSPAVFVFLFGIIMPLQFGLNLEPEKVWQAAVAACFLGGVIELLGGFAGPYIRKIIPRAAMLATVAGIALVWMGTKGLYDVYASPILGMPVLMIAIIGLIGGYMFPGKIPPLLVSLVFGIIYALALGEATFDLTGVGEATPPIFALGDIIAGFKLIVPFLSVIIPIEIYNFIETMDNVESAIAAGDNYDVGEAQIVDGIATMLSALFGGVVPNTVWLGHAGLKKGDAGIGYSWLSSILYIICGFFGVFYFFYNLMPEVLIAITYIWCAVIMVAQAFIDTPRRHGAAIAMGLIPHLANYAYTEITGALSAVGVEEVTAEVGQKLLDSGVMWGGLEALNNGAIITGMAWATMVVFIIDRSLDKAGHTSLFCAVVSFFGFIHASELGINAAPIGYTIGYLSMALICYGMHIFRDKLHVPRRYDYV